MSHPDHPIALPSMTLSKAALLLIMGAACWAVLILIAWGLWRLL